ncbi:hypothetical protein AVEN_25982-1 [Araneus ventricosus]|uniref:Uncharacterized protein n=1 Tax=Araneus ventricosus TaxID=182803 RepID=A0A4Y2LDZ8_ARAVE|nr:hypothetical protein AVEN_25982-1 [Araneus ventricosus]
MMKATPELAAPSPNFRTPTTGGRLTITYDLTWSRDYTRRICSGIGFQTWSPAETLPLGHRGSPFERYTFTEMNVRYKRSKLMVKYC